MLIILHIHNKIHLFGNVEYLSASNPLTLFSYVDVKCSVQMLINRVDSFKAHSP